jgi:hypothetical protein
MGYHDSSRLPLDRLDPLYKVECWDYVHWWGLRFTTGIVGWSLFHPYSFWKGVPGQGEPVRSWDDEEYEGPPEDKD